MKRPVAELLTMTLLPESESARTPYEQEAWQILRRKQGYVTHRLYCQVADSRQRLVYSEWDSKKASDGARQYLHNTPLTRRARALLAATPQRLIVELVGPISSSKGLEVPSGTVAALGMARIEDPDLWQRQAEALSQLQARQAGHLGHVLFRGFDDPPLVGALSHWHDAASLEAAHAQIAAQPASSAMQLFQSLASVQYRPVPD